MKNRTIIIAEAGVNHNGDIANAFKLIDVAKNAGADYVKFQTFKAENLVSEEAPKAEYQIENMQGTTETQFDMLKKLELSSSDHKRLIDYCNEIGIQFFSTAFDLDSLDYLQEIGLEIVKIPSGELTNLPYLQKAAQLFKSVIISTGMANLEDIRTALKVFTNSNIPLENICILHCNTEYPTPMKDVNLKAMLHIQREFGTAIGYSDHTQGVEVPIAAVALGASVIEKHFTLDKNMAGPDHRASLEPHELSQMVLSIRNIEDALEGSGIKEPSESERKNIAIARKSIYVAVDIKQGQVIQSDQLIMLRPGDGISPMELPNIIGKKALMNLPKGTKLSLSDIES